MCRFQLIPAPANTPLLPLPRQPERRIDRRGQLGRERRQAAVLPRSSACVSVTRVAQVALAVQFRREAAGSCATARPSADAPAQPVAQIDAVRIAAHDERRRSPRARPARSLPCSRSRRSAKSILPVPTPSSSSFAVGSLIMPAQRERRRLLPPLRRQVDLRAQPQVARAGCPTSPGARTDAR